jgi:CheY-like chemotaxis protein
MSARILVVNDTQEILELFRMILEGEAYEVILSGFPIQRIQDVEEINPDLIILDFVFGDQKIGWQMLQMLKMHRSTESIPVIVCTAALDRYVNKRAIWSPRVFMSSTNLSTLIT